MSNERIDLTKDGLRKSIREHEERYHEPTIEDVETILSCLEGIGLLAELKRCYEEIDRLAHTERCYLRAIEIFDPKGKHDDLSYAIQQAFDE